MENVTLLTRSLGFGGAERQVALLARGLRDRDMEVSVLIFYGGGHFQEHLEAEGVDVRPLGKGGRWDVFPFLWAVRKRLAESRPDVVYSFLPIPNLVATAVTATLSEISVVWGIRASHLDLLPDNWLEKWSRRVESLLSRCPAHLIANSEAARNHAVERGIPAGRLTVVHNAVDGDRFRPRPEEGRRVRGELGIPEDGLVIGRVGRVEPTKDYPTFLRAVAPIVEQIQELHVLCVGARGKTEYEESVRRLGEDLGLDERVIWCPPRGDMTSVYNAMTVLCSSSRGEGFPNVIAEAMACGIPCVATDAGDSRLIVGDTGRIVRSGDPIELGEALQDMLSADLDRLSAAARTRVEENFGIDRMIERTLGVLEKVAGAPLPGPTRSRGRTK